MKKAKVRDGLIQHVWPNTKTLADGTIVTTELPRQYWSVGNKPTPDCIIDVPDNVKPGWKWNGKKFAPIVKEPLVKRRDFMVDVLADKLGMSYEDLLKEAKARRKSALTKAK